MLKVKTWSLTLAPPPPCQFPLSFAVSTLAMKWIRGQGVKPPGGGMDYIVRDLQGAECAILILNKITAHVLVAVLVLLQEELRTLKHAT